MLRLFGSIFLCADHLNCTSPRRYSHHWISPFCCNSASWFDKVISTFVIEYFWLCILYSSLRECQSSDLICRCCGLTQMAITDHIHSDKSGDRGKSDFGSIQFLEKHRLQAWPISFKLTRFRPRLALPAVFRKQRQMDSLPGQKRHSKAPARFRRALQI